MWIAGALAWGLVVWAMAKKYDNTVNHLYGQIAALQQGLGGRCFDLEDEVKKLRREVEYLKKTKS